MAGLILAQLADSSVEAPLRCLAQSRAPVGNEGERGAAGGPGGEYQQTGARERLAGCDLPAQVGEPGPLGNLDHAAGKLSKRSYRYQASSATKIGRWGRL